MKTIKLQKQFAVVQSIGSVKCVIYQKYVYQRPYSKGIFCCATIFHCAIGLVNFVSCGEISHPKYASRISLVPGSIPFIL